ncbi:hypothetical protein ATCC90586_003609 [Pythium insidiosum]|nr:hypothetical protein ATCC90586_003609 [Pythium insidiosum]
MPSVRRSTLLAVFGVLVLALTATNAHMPRRPPRAGGPGEHGFPRGGRMGQALHSIEFNGVMVLHEDLLHSMSPHQETIDVTQQGINVQIRFQHDEMVIHPKAKPTAPGRIAIVHNETEQELHKTSLRYDAGSRSQLRGDLHFDSDARRRLRRQCANSTCHVHVILASRAIRSSIIELGNVKFYKKKSKTHSAGVKLLTYPRLVEGKSQPWLTSDLTWSAVFHFFLIFGFGLMALIGVEAWRVYGLVSPKEDGAAASRRWLLLSMVCVVVYISLCVGRAMGWLTMQNIVYFAPLSAVIGVAALLRAGGPVEEFCEDMEPTADEEDDEEISDDEPKKDKQADAKDAWIPVEPAVFAQQREAPDAESEGKDRESLEQEHDVLKFFDDDESADEDEQETSGGGGNFVFLRPPLADVPISPEYTEGYIPVHVEVRP